MWCGLFETHREYDVFFREFFSMVFLSSKYIKIPVIFDFNIRNKVIWMEYVDGNNLKTMLAIVGAGKEFENLYILNSYILANSLKKYYKRTNKIWQLFSF